MLWLGIKDSVSAWLSTNPTASSERLVVSAAHAVAALYENGVSMTGNSRAGTRTGHGRSSLATSGYTGRMVNTRLPASKAPSGASRADANSRSPVSEVSEDGGGGGGGGDCGCGEPLAMLMFPPVDSESGSESDSDSDSDSNSEDTEISRIRYSTPGKMPRFARPWKIGDEERSTQTHSTGGW